MVLEVQILGALFMAVMLYLTFLFYKRNNYSKVSFYMWMGVWVAGAALLLFPNLSLGLVRELRFARVTDLYIALALMFFTMVTFFNFVSVKKQEKTVENLVRAIALEKGKKK